MNLLILVFVALTTWPNAFAMYYTGTKEVFQPPPSRTLQKNSYFGYSITYDSHNKKLIISAPRENNIGEVYDCSIEDRACTPIDKNNTIPRRSSDYEHEYWFGATVKAGKEIVMMCAPRYTDLLKNTYATTGKCYQYETSGDKTLRERRQITDTERLRDVSAPFLMEKTMDSFGWSMDVTPSDSVIVGGPGMYQGRAMFYEQPDIHKVPKLLKKGETKSIPAPEFNFGYAVASGRFINNDWSFAVSSPYGTGGHGKVLFYKGEVFLQSIHGIEDTSQVGSMFGAVLCAAKLFGDRTDLLVGAPAYADKDTRTYNLGAVYVYLARKRNKAPVFHRRIVSKVSGSMFGSAIISVGDLNGDKKDEIAVSAPFENDRHGVVYIYSGADLISNPTKWYLKHMQRIEAETSYGESFGMSLTALLDYDENGCKELAIGSPYNNTVVLLRCMAAVIVETSAKFPNLQERNSSQNKFDFEVCLSVKYPKYPRIIIADLLTTVEIQHDSAKLLTADGTGSVKYKTSLEEKKMKYCNNISLLLPSNGKYDTKISYTISSKLQNDPRTLPDFNSSRVILSDVSVLIKRDSVWAAECAGNTTCMANLTLTPYISFHHGDDPYIIGSSVTETMNMTVYNTGEVAYEPCVRVHIRGANVFTTPTGCVHDGQADRHTQTLVCEPPKPIRTNQNWTTGQIVLEMTHLTNLDKSININMLLFDRCEEEDVFTKNISNTIPLEADPRGITVKGGTDIGSIVKMKKEDIEENGKKLQHVYTITNKGPTNWQGLEVLVNLPRKPYIEYGDTPVTVYYSTSNSYPPCSFVSQNETSKSFKCYIESLITQVEFAKILIPMYIVPGTLDGILNKDKNFTIISSVELLSINTDHNVESITTIITLEEATVSIETIIIAVVVGLCIIIIIAVILYRVGFLRRKKKEELKKLKISVKRQTILRRSTMPSQAPQAEDRKQILESTQEENENDHTQDLNQA